MTEQAQPTTRFSTNPRITAGTPFAAWTFPVSHVIENYTVELGYGSVSALYAAPQGEDGKEVDLAQARGEVLLVHGYTGSKEDFMKVIPLLAKAGYSVWAYTQRGCPGSETAETYALEDFAQDVCEFANVVRLERPHLLGHSFGGVVATHAVVSAVQRYRERRFASLVQFCTGPHGWAGRCDETLAVLAGGTVGSMFGDDSVLTGKDPQAAWDYRRGQEQNVEQLVAGAHILTEHEDITAALGATGTPVCVMFGEDDDAWPQDWQRATAATLGAPVVVIAGAGHCPNTDNPRATVAELVSFYESVEAP
ncbi:alpha/beta hydrolase [Micrococcales bacterium 31B]|nr:alpha/beta hydrolase [Micrococcales bacterium 31B]